jgi:hypothetical protein
MISELGRSIEADDRGAAREAAPLLITLGGLVALGIGVYIMSDNETDPREPAATIEVQEFLTGEAHAELGGDIQTVARELVTAPTVDRSDDVVVFDYSTDDVVSGQARVPTDQFSSEEGRTVLILTEHLTDGSTTKTEYTTSNEFLSVETTRLDVDGDEISSHFLDFDQADDFVHEVGPEDAVADARALDRAALESMNNFLSGTHRPVIVVEDL